MCRHFDLNFFRGLEKLFLMGVDTKDLNGGGGGGVRIINGMVHCLLATRWGYSIFDDFPALRLPAGC